MQTDHEAHHTAALYNAAWHVRYYRRPHQFERRAAAWLQMGLAARAAFNATDHFTPLLLAIAIALKDVT